MPDSSTVLQALLIGGMASAALVAGAAVAVRFDVPERVLAWLLALASGSLVVAAAIELFQPAARELSTAGAAAGVLAGAALFSVIDSGIDRFFDPSEAGDEAAGAGGRARRGVGWSMVAAVVVDGVPENLALGALAGSSGGVAALAAAIFVSNFPEAINGSAAMRARGLGSAQILGVWTLAGAALTAASVLGAILFEGGSRGGIGLPMAIASGGVVAALADTLFPRAYRLGDSWVPLATAVGFVLAALLAD